eukprot:TRINITY_DN21_c2_g1_i1.p1 TRINITY_DN21_c2_g1~~TRINITY_DN21_c2_g1_i1.p1  ORF type:complete len:638 (-),score=117.56 TRINITY_DN21_c2_g1_i1:229-2061(-)
MARLPMAKRAVALLIACCGLLDVASAAAPTAVPTSAPTSSPTSAPAAIRTVVDVMGQSGKFTVYDEKKGKNSGITITMDALSEVGSDGNAVGASGSTKHSINTFAAQAFTIDPQVDVSLGDVDTSLISFSSPISTIGQIQVDTYIIKNAGMVGPPGEEWSVGPGDLKWSINLSSWSWCGCTKGRQAETGAFIDVVISVKGMGTPKQKGNSAKSLDMGDNVTLELSDQVQVGDAQWESMPAGFPKMEFKGSSAIFTFRFPKFSSWALYDPVLSGLAPPEVQTPAPTTSPTAVPTASPTAVPTAGPTFQILNSSSGSSGSSSNNSSSSSSSSGGSSSNSSSGGGGPAKNETTGSPTATPTASPTTKPTTAAGGGQVNATTTTSFSSKLVLNSVDDFNETQYLASIAAAAGIDSANVKVKSVTYVVAVQYNVPSGVSESDFGKSVAQSVGVAEEKVTVTFQTARRLREAPVRMLQGVLADVEISTSSAAATSDLSTKAADTTALAAQLSTVTGQTVELTVAKAPSLAVVVETEMESTSATPVEAPDASSIAAKFKEISGKDVSVEVTNVQQVVVETTTTETEEQEDDETSDSCRTTWAAKRLFLLTSAFALYL